MSKKVIYLKDYKRSRSNNPLTFVEFMLLLLNILICFSLISLFIIFAMNPPENKEFGRIIGTLALLFTIYHFIKVFTIIKRKEIKNNLSYLVNYVMFICVLCGLFSLFSYAVIEPLLTKIKWSIIFAISTIINIFLLRRLSKYGNLF